jgi:hypothetical protein
MNSQVQDWGSAIMASLTGAMSMFFAAVPRIIGFLLILIIGWFVASLIAKAIASLPRAVHFNDLATRAGITDFVKKMGVQSDASEVVAAVAKWFVRLIVLVVAFDALGVPALSNVLQQLLMWLPNLVVAVVVLVIAGLAAKALAALVRGATSKGGFGNPDLLAKIASVAVWAFATVIAVNQLGIAQRLVNTLFTAVVGGLALALGLAFGLGGKDAAGQLVNDWYPKGKKAAPKAKAAARGARQQTQ